MLDVAVLLEVADDVDVMLDVGVLLEVADDVAVLLEVTDNVAVPLDVDVLLNVADDVDVMLDVAVALDVVLDVDVSLDVDDDVDVVLGVAVVLEVADDVDVMLVVAVLLEVADDVDVTLDVEEDVDVLLDVAVALDVDVMLVVAVLLGVDEGVAVVVDVDDGDDVTLDVEVPVSVLLDDDVDVDDELDVLLDVDVIVDVAVSLDVAVIVAVAEDVLVDVSPGMRRLHHTHITTCQKLKTHSGVASAAWRAGTHRAPAQQPSGNSRVGTAPNTLPPMHAPGGASTVSIIPPQSASWKRTTRRPRGCSAATLTPSRHSPSSGEHASRDGPSHSAPWNSRCTSQSVGEVSAAIPAGTGPHTRRVRVRVAAPTQPLTTKKWHGAMGAQRGAKHARPAVAGQRTTPLLHMKPKQRVRT
jgi:hypothetical protein